MLAEKGPKALPCACLPFAMVGSGLAVGRGEELHDMFSPKARSFPFCFALYTTLKLFGSEGFHPNPPILKVWRKRTEPEMLTPQKIKEI
jgi:hypothetical protein